jgi:transposase InsO family protein
MRRMDALHLEFPFAGSRMLRDLLADEGIAVGRLHVATLMNCIGIEALYRRTSTSRPVPGHRIYPYLLRYKAEVIHWRSFEAVEFAALTWVDWFNNRRLLEPIGNIPPAEAEARF